MRIFEWIEDNLAAFVVATIAALLSSLCGYVLMTVIPAKLLHDEWSYGIPLLFGIPVAIVVGVVVFLLVFRKLR